MTANIAKNRKMIIDLDKLDPAIAVMIDHYPHDIEQVKHRFFTYWPLFDLLGVETTAATIRANVDQLCFTAESLLAIWLCGFTGGFANMTEAWNAAYKFVQIDGDDDDEGENEDDNNEQGADKIIRYQPNDKKKGANN